MINITAKESRVYDVELLGQVHRMEEEEYISFLESLDNLPRPAAMCEEQEPEAENLFSAIWQALTKPKLPDEEPVKEWDPDTSVDDMAETVDSKEDEDVKVYVQPAQEPEAVEEEKTEPEEIQSVVPTEPEEEHVGSAPEKIKVRKWTKEDLQKYVGMAIANIPRKEVISTMIQELDVKPANASNLYYNRVLPGMSAELKAKGIVEKPEYQGKEPEILKVTPEPEPIQVIAPAIVDKISPVTESKPKEPTKLHLEDGEIKAFKDKSMGQSVAEIARECYVTKEVVEEIALMPVYDSPRTFKDQICIRESMNKQYSTDALKKVYRATHIGTRW